ncbi:AI-2E family transporter [Microvirga makkahensis]|uniref:AI-2E family transporter n=1 Tax=Microvirga makkahensis TaxID=1128670 RepID=A0A7X3SP04_9HYPH|nr:AI-2E family transporter [Microvirga makkahensis]
MGAVPALVFATTMDLATLLWTAAAVMIIQQLEGNVIRPFIQQRAVSMPPALVHFAIVVFGVTFGWLGILLAVPLAVAITVLAKKHASARLRARAQLCPVRSKLHPTRLRCHPPGGVILPPYGLP